MFIVKTYIVLSLFFAMFFSTAPLLAEEYAADLISTQGSVEILPSGQNSWEKAHDFQKLYPRDTIRTGELSRAAILFIDQTQIKLNEKTILEIKDIKLGNVTEVSWGRSAKSLFNLISGEIWIRSGAEIIDLQVDTPVASATIRGTEFVIKTDKKKTSVTVVDGTVNLKNEYGEVTINSGEEGIAEIDKPPYKTVVINPEDAVQWSLYYPGNVSPKDYYNIPPFEMAVIEKSFEFYRQKELEKAIKLVKESLDKQFPDSPHLLTQAGFGLLMAGSVKSAKENIEKALSISPNYSLAHSILSNIYLVQNNKEKAKEEAELAVKTNPNSPSAFISLAWVRQSYFDIPGAIEAVKKAVELDDKNIQALVTLCRLYFGSDKVKEANEIIEKAVSIAPDESTVNATKGFILLAQAETKKSIGYFINSIKQDSTQGLGHLGLGLAYIRMKNIAEGLREMLIATLLEPKVSLYQSYLGKAYYQVGKEYARFGVKKEEAPNYEKYIKLAEKTLEYATYLDPKDPTPYLYSGLIFSDLYRPVDATEKLDKSVELNNNRAVYRSKLLLDRDLATENISLARAYNMLRLNSWGGYLAMRSVQSDFGTSGGHSFLGHIYGRMRGRVIPALSELLQARLMMPVNENSFNTYNNYSSLFETPEFNAKAVAMAGNDGIREYTGVLNGGSGEYAFSQLVSYYYEDGYLPKNNDYEMISTITYLKYALDMRSHVYASFASLFQDRGWDPDSWDPFYSDPNFRLNSELEELTLGYHNEITPDTHILIFTKAKNDAYKYRDEILLASDSELFNAEDKVSDTTKFWDGQLELIQRFGRHQFICALNYYDGQQILDEKIKLDSFKYEFPQMEAPQRYTSLLLKDYWRFSEMLEFDLGIRYDRTVNGDPFYDAVIKTSDINPQAGLVFLPFKNTALRAAIIKSTRGPLEETIFPTSTSGFIIDYTEQPSSRNTEYSLAWDQIVDKKTFFTISGSYRDRETPYFTLNDKFTSANFSLNRILNRFIAISGEYSYLNSDDNLGKRKDNQVKLNLNFMHPNGWYAEASETCVYQKNKEFAYRDPFDTSFWITDLSIGYYFPKKRGKISVIGSNIFDSEFTVVTDPLALDKRPPARQIVLRTELYF